MVPGFYFCFFLGDLFVFFSYPFPFPFYALHEPLS